MSTRPRPWSLTAARRVPGELNARTVTGVFDRPEALLAATRGAREAGLPVVDAYTPFPVHGLDEAMGLRRSRLGVACFLFGLAGAALALGAQVWTSATDWPLNVGGKPFDSLPAFVPIAFEVTVLFAGLGVVLALFLRCGLGPGRRECLAAPRVTDDRFVLVLRLAGARATVADARSLLERHGVIAVTDAVEATP
jgi:hypothetical protein